MSAARRFHLIVAILLCSACASAIASERAQATASKQVAALQGSWYSIDGTVTFKTDGTLVYNGEIYYYQVGNGVIQLLGRDGSSVIPYRLAGGKLSVTADGKVTVFARSKPAETTTKQAAGSNHSGRSAANLAGKWCYMSNVYASSGGRMSNRCFTLHANGRYEYYAETSSSGQYGSAATQESDRGTWSASDSALTANSERNGRHVYRLEKRNHPKNKNDPMLVLEGEAYVTATARQPW